MNDLFPDQRIMDYVKELEAKVKNLEEQLKVANKDVECDENWIEAYQQRYAKLDE